MPLILHNTPNSDCEWAVWKVTESPEDQLKRLQELGIYAEVPFFRNPNRLSEWLTARLLLSEMGVKQRIRYDEAGKPHLEGDGSVSISLSHSSGHVAAIKHSKRSTGIDIEKTGDRILKVSHKFVGPDEEAWIRTGSDDQLVQFYRIWGAKECAFKIYGRGGVDFRANLFVEPPSISPSEPTLVTLRKQEITCQYHVFFEYLDDMILTYGFEV